MAGEAEVINKGGTDKTVLFAVRTELFQPFQAPDWTDLRVGYLLSITGGTADDDPTSPAVQAETIVATSFFDRYWIGVMDLTRAMFIGYTNAGVGDTVLSSSDGGVGAGTDFWWPNNSASNIASGGIFSLSGGFQVRSTDGIQQHFAQDVVGAGGYATMFLLRFRRDDAGLRRITVTLKQNTIAHSGDVLFTDTPSENLLEENLASFPSTVQTWGPITLFHVPEAMYVYWPFRGSRIRLHACGPLKAL
jgi:hypothetical protein